MGVCVWRGTERERERHMAGRERVILEVGVGERRESNTEEIKDHRKIEQPVGYSVK